MTDERDHEEAESPEEADGGSAPPGGVPEGAADFDRPDSSVPEASRRLLDEAERVSSRFSDQVRRAVEGSGVPRRLTEAARGAQFTSPALEQLQRIQRDQEDRQEEMGRISEGIRQAQEKKDARADAQAHATLEIAAGQEQLRELQQQAVSLASEQASATAELAKAQQEVLASIREELEVLREQHATLREQAAGQERLIHSGWASGAVMEWTLYVALLALVATIVLGVTTPTWWHWLVGGLAVVVSALVLAMSQRRRKPSGDL